MDTFITGNYTITAIYNGSESLKGSSSSIDFYAVDQIHQVHFICWMHKMLYMEIQLP